MAGYLEEYGVADARRSRIIWILVGSLVLVGVIALVLYFSLRTWPAKRLTGRFLDDLRRHDYQAAYRDWGCPNGCSDYPFHRFMEDWGPKGQFPDPSAVSVAKTRYCNGDVIVTVAAGKANTAYLWYDHRHGVLGFAPWNDLCNPHIPAPATAAQP
jgi:hypothetical protein